jgi:hypothetical protein
MERKQGNNKMQVAYRVEPRRIRQMIATQSLLVQEMHPAKGENERCHKQWRQNRA